MPLWNVPTNFTPKTKVSILIPVRNEADYIGLCLNAILKQKYPSNLVEIIVINDHSEDDTLKIIQAFQKKHKNIKCLELANYIDENNTTSFKKKALTIGIHEASGELIVQTDGDCEMREEWLNLIVSLYETKQAKFIAAPVNFYKNNNLLQRFQALDFKGMMCVTGAGLYRKFALMCNGANMAYPKSAFEKVNGFEGIDTFASGDDMMLLQKIANEYPNDIEFLKNKKATVYTEAKPTLKEFAQQRIRWATKAKGTGQDIRATLILAMVFFFCINIIVSTFVDWRIFLAQISIKAMMDFIFLGMMCRFFKQQSLMWWFLPSLFLHTLYIAIIGVVSNLVKKYQWKGRKVI